MSVNLFFKLPDEKKKKYLDKYPPSFIIVCQHRLVKNDAVRMQKIHSEVFKQGKLCHERFIKYLCCAYKRKKKQQKKQTLLSQKHQTWLVV